MLRQLIVPFGVAAAIALGGCAGMSTTEQRTLSGAAIGTAAGGYLYDKEKEKQRAAEERAYQQGVQAGKQQK